VAVWALLIVAVAVGGAVITATNLPDVRRAESDVIVRLGGLDFSEIDRQLDSYVVVAESETVIGPAAREIGMSPLDLRDAMTVGLIGDSAVIRFGVEDVDEETALAANTAVVQQYLSVVNTPADESFLVFIDGEIDGVRASLLGIESSLGTLAIRRSDNAARRAGLTATQETLRGRLVSLYARRTDIQTGAAVPGTSISAIQAEIDDLQEQLDTVTSEVELIESAEATDAAAEAQLFSEQGALRSELSRLEDRRVGLGIDQLGQARARVLTSPHMIADSGTPTAARGGAFGLAVGLILALVFVVFVSRLRQRQ
jgi:tetrahydromethanopterin S-methyltransferase subunit G